MAKTTKEYINYIFKGDTKNLNSALDTANKKMGSFVKSVGKVAGGVTLVTGAVFGLTKKVSDNIDAFAKSAEVIGVSVETYAGISLAAETAGTSMEAIKGIMLKGIDAQDQYTEGNEDMVKVLDDLGVSVYDANGQLKNQASFTKDVFSALEDMGDSAERDSAIMEIFGRKGIDPVNKLLAQGTDVTYDTIAAVEEHTSVNEENAKIYEKLNDTIAYAKFVIVDYLVEGLTPVAEFITNTLIGAYLTLTGQTEDLTDDQLIAIETFQGVVEKLQDLKRVLLIVAGAFLILKVITAITTVVQLIYMTTALIPVIGATWSFVTALIAEAVAFAIANAAAILMVAGILLLIGVLIYLLTQTKLGTAALYIFQALLAFNNLKARILKITLELLADVIGWLLKGAIDIILGPLDEMYRAFKYISENAEELSTILNGALTDALDKVYGFFDKVNRIVDTLVGKIKDLATAIEDELINAVNKIPFVDIGGDKLLSTKFGIVGSASGVSNNSNQTFNYNITAEKAPTIRELRSQKFGFITQGGSFVN